MDRDLLRGVARMSERWTESGGGLLVAGNTQVALLRSPYEKGIDSLQSCSGWIRIWLHATDPG